MLPNSIHVKKITKVDEKFHARYSAKKRVYRYIISTKEKNPFESKYVTYNNEVEFDSLSKNIKIFEGEFDFSYFIKLGSQTKTNIRTIYKTLAYKHKDYIVLYFMANGFLRTQIRFMVSSLINLDKKQIKEMLYLKKRYKIKPAIPNGLYLAKIKY
jgi:tRNA pseudouridine38-40 synthase